MNADPKTISSLNSSEESTGRDPTQNSNLPERVAAGTVPRWHIWLWRLRALLLVTLCASFGVLLVILPWTPKWTDNPLLLSSPELRMIVSSGFVRGLASGLGLLDLWLGFWEAIHYHEKPVGSGR